MHEMLVGRVSSPFILSCLLNTDPTPSEQVPFDHDDPNEIRRLTLTDRVSIPPHAEMSDHAVDLIQDVSAPHFISLCAKFTFPPVAAKDPEPAFNCR